MLGRKKTAQTVNYDRSVAVAVLVQQDVISDYKIITIKND